MKKKNMIFESGMRKRMQEMAGVREPVAKYQRTRGNDPAMDDTEPDDREVRIFIEEKIERPLYYFFGGDRIEKIIRKLYNEVNAAAKKSNVKSEEATRLKQFFADACKTMILTCSEHMETIDNIVSEMSPGKIQQRDEWGDPDPKPGYNPNASLNEVQDMKAVNPTKYAHAKDDRYFEYVTGFDTLRDLTWNNRVFDNVLEVFGPRSENNPNPIQHPMMPELKKAILLFRADLKDKLNAFKSQAMPSSISSIS
jgi:hypothetical protein